MRFKLGEMAIFMFTITGAWPEHEGKECQIVEIGPWPAGQPTVQGPSCCVSDYVVKFADGRWRYCCDFQLRKINPSEEPASLTHQELSEIES